MSARNSMRAKAERRTQRRVRKLRLRRAQRFTQAPGIVAKLMRGVGVPFHMLICDGVRCLGCDWYQWQDTLHVTDGLPVYVAEEIMADIELVARHARG